MREMLLVLHAGRSANRATAIRVVRSLAEHRIVTVVGPGGMGKTRLSLELLDRLTAPVHVVELALLSRDEDVPVATAAAGVASGEW